MSTARELAAVVREGLPNRPPEDFAEAEMPPWMRKAYENDQRLHAALDALVAECEQGWKAASGLSTDLSRLGRELEEMQAECEKRGANERHLTNLLSWREREGTEARSALEEMRRERDAAREDVLFLCEDEDDIRKGLRARAEAAERERDEARASLEWRTSEFHSAVAHRRRVEARDSRYKEALRKIAEAASERVEHGRPDINSRWVESVARAALTEEENTQ